MGRIVFGVLFMLIGLYFLTQAFTSSGEASLGAGAFTFIFWAIGLPMIIYGSKAAGRPKA
jgi:hypothetical protein